MCFIGQTSKVFNSWNERFGGKIISNDMKIAENRTFGIHTSNTNKQRERIKRRNRENHIGIGIERLIGPVIERDRSIGGVIENVMLKRRDVTRRNSQHTFEERSLTKPGPLLNFGGVQRMTTDVRFHPYPKIWSTLSGRVSRVVISTRFE